MEQQKSDFAVRLHKNKTVAERMPDNEKDRQIYRKKKVTNSRFLDNYWNPVTHQEKYWKPNGMFVTKKLFFN